MEGDVSAFRSTGRPGIGAKEMKVSPETSHRQQAQSAMSNIPTQLQNHLKFARMLNKDGKVVEPTLAGAAASRANWNQAAQNNFYIILVDEPV